MELVGTEADDSIHHCSPEGWEDALYIIIIIVHYTAFVVHVDEYEVIFVTFFIHSLYEFQRLPSKLNLLTYSNLQAINQESIQVSWIGLRIRLNQHLLLAVLHLPVAFSLDHLVWLLVVPLVDLQNMPDIGINTLNNWPYFVLDWIQLRHDKYWYLMKCVILQKGGRTVDGGRANGSQN